MYLPETTFQILRPDIINSLKICLVTTPTCCIYDLLLILLFPLQESTRLGSYITPTPSPSIQLRYVYAEIKQIFHQNTYIFLYLFNQITILVSLEADGTGTRPPTWF